MKAFRYRLYPTKKQEHLLFWTLARCRELYNAALSERKDAYKYEHKSITYRMQADDLPEIKGIIREEYQDIHSQVLQDVLKRLDKAFKAFFRRVQNGEQPGYPRFQGRNRFNSFTYPQGGYSLWEKHISLSKIGTVKCVVHRPMIGKPKTCTIKYEAGQWYAVFSCEVEAPEKLPLSYEDVGIDLGVLHLATLSNGETIEHPRNSRRGEKKIKQLHQALSRKKRGSHRRAKAKQALSKAYRKVRNQRRDALHKASRELVNRYQVIVFEELEEAHLVKRPKPKQDETTGEYLPNGASAKAGLNKSILDAGWGQFVQMTSAKAECAGRTVLFVNPYKTSQICSGCGTVVKKDLDVRWHSCECGTELDRDHNAAINILRLGQKQLARKEPTWATA
jgi:putative transposase